MEKEEIKKIIEDSLEDFFIKDQDLIEVNANERSISHKIAEYIQKRVPEWNVDCEYNRSVDYQDGGKDIPKRLQSLVRNIKTNDTEGSTVFPDIIIHKRRKKEYCENKYYLKTTR